MGRWRAGERYWARLIRAHAALDARQLSDGERRLAAREGRVLLVEHWRDGFGGGQVYFSSPDEAELVEWLEEKDGRLGGLVCFAQHVVSETDINRLRPNAWETISEVPALAELQEGLAAVRAALSHRNGPAAPPNPPTLTKKKPTANGPAKKHIPPEREALEVDDEA